MDFCKKKGGAIMQTKNIEYRDGTTSLEGYLAYDRGVEGKRPLIIIAHAWAGRDNFVLQKAELLAKLGFVGFALDMYGKDIIGENKDENAKLMAPFMEDRGLLQRRVLAGLNAAREQSMVDVNRIGAIGYCFGGLCVLDLARSGADIKGVVSFHGLLIAPENLPNEKIQAKILALHGYDDPMVPSNQVSHFQNEMTQSAVDWQMHVYGNTMHAFTNPEANDYNFGTIYNKEADKRSWQAMQNFFTSTFKT